MPLNPFQKAKLKLDRRDWQTHTDKPDVDIVAIYEELTGNSTRRTGKATMALCPFHGEHNPSFAMYEETGTYYCFSCQEHGDAFNLIMKLNGVSFPEAIEFAKVYEK